MKLKTNYRAFGDHILRSPAQVATALAFAQNIVAFAEADATRYVDTGDYIHSFAASAKVGKPANGATRRAVGTAANTSAHALFVEFGSQRVRPGGLVVTTPARHTLSRAAGATRSAGVAGIV